MKTGIWLFDKVFFISRQHQMLNKFIYSFLLRASIPAFGVINFMIIVRLFERELVGIWVLYMTILAFVEVAKDGFLKNATIWLLNKNETKASGQILSSSLLINLFITGTFIILIVIVATITLSLGTAEYEPLIYLLLIYCIQLIISVPFTHIDYFLSSRLKFKQMMFAFLIKNFTFFSFLIISFFFFRTNIRLEYLVGFQTIGVLFGVFFLSRNFSPRFGIKNYTKEFVNKILGFGKYVFATNASSVLFRSTDHYMLAGLIGSGSVAFYNVALRITNLVDLPSTAAAEVIFPMTVKSTNTVELKQIYENTVSYIVAFAIPVTVFIYFFAEPIVVFIAGESYLSAVNILRVTLAYGLLLPFLKQFGTIINSIDRPKINFYLMFSTFLLNIIFNYLFITEFGLLGAAYGTLVTYIFCFLAAQLILKKYIGVELSNIPGNLFAAYRKIFHRIID